MAIVFLGLAILIILGQKKYPEVSLSENRIP